MFLLALSLSLSLDLSPSLSPPLSLSLSTPSPSLSPSLSPPLSLSCSHTRARTHAHTVVCCPFPDKETRIGGQWRKTKTSPISCYVPRGAYPMKLGRGGEEGSSLGGTLNQTSRGSWGRGWGGGGAWLCYSKKSVFERGFSE